MGRGDIYLEGWSCGSEALKQSPETIVAEEAEKTPTEEGGALLWSAGQSFQRDGLYNNMLLL